MGATVWHIQIRLRQIATGGRDNIAVIIKKRSKMGIKINGGQNDNVFIRELGSGVYRWSGAGFTD